MRQRAGGCNCGQVRFVAEGEPLRVGLCHCLTCRRDTGSAFNAYAIWPADRVRIAGEVRSWSANTDRRSFCPRCGASLFSTVEGSGKVEVRLGVLDDAPSGLAPSYELWVRRREGWLPPVAAEQHGEDRA